MSPKRGADRFAHELATAIRKHPTLIRAAEAAGGDVERIASELACLAPEADGRPTERLSFRLSDRDAAAVHAWARELECTTSQLLRRLVVIALERREQESD